MPTHARVWRSWYISDSCSSQGLSFFQAGGGIRYTSVTGVQTCALPISAHRRVRRGGHRLEADEVLARRGVHLRDGVALAELHLDPAPVARQREHRRLLQLGEHVVVGDRKSVV